MQGTTFVAAFGAWHGGMSDKFQLSKSAAICTEGTKKALYTIFAKHPVL